MIIVGGGLGGLLSAALFSKDANVTLFERSRSVGGRFRNIQREGFSLSTGALHMLPHGSTGPVANILRMAGANCDIVDSDPYGTFLHDGKELRFHELRSSLPFHDKVKVAKMFLALRYLRVPDISLQEYLEQRFKDPIYLSVAKCIIGWSTSITPSEIGMYDFSAIIRNIVRYGGPGIPIGGCGGVIKALMEVIKRNGVNIVHEGVSSILVEDGGVKGIETRDGEEHYDECVVSDVGAKCTMELCPKASIPSDLRKRIDGMRPSGGVKINVSSDESLLNHNGVLFPLDCERVEGINEATKADSTLAPEGKHLTMSHQTLQGRNVRSEIEKGITDLEETFRGKDFRVICAQTYF
ncbi:MAG: NAD(P)-binding protein, partial [Candidatus Methanofastidiosa archaeon]|nr:NAD(P)-binding protein [Candidatus Methanofastidiosa archaeon]